MRVYHELPLCTLLAMQKARLPQSPRRVHAGTGEGSRIYKDALTDEWSTLFSDVAAGASTRSVVDNLLARPAHFYRVVLVAN
jgi:hypothetical protein